jgi:hypothetical protein
MADLESPRSFHAPPFPARARSRGSKTRVGTVSGTRNGFRSLEAGSDPEPFRSLEAGSDPEPERRRSVIL